MAKDVANILKVSFIESLVLTCAHTNRCSDPLEAYDRVVLTIHLVPLYWAKSPPLSPADLHSAHRRTWTWLLLPAWGTRGFTSSATYSFFRPLDCSIFPVYTHLLQPWLHLLWEDWEEQLSQYHCPNLPGSSKSAAWIEQYFALGSWLSSV